MKIVLIVDGSQASLEASNLAFQLSSLWGCPVDAIIIIDSGLSHLLGDEWISSSSTRNGFSHYLEHSLQKEASRFFDTIAVKASGFAIPLSTELKIGNPQDVIAKLGSSDETALLILPRPGSIPGDLPTLRFNLNSLLKSVQCPLLIAGNTSLKI